MTRERKGVLCNSPDCEFYGADYAHCCGLPAFLQQDFKLRDMDKLHRVVEEHRCQSPVLMDACSNARLSERRRP